VPVCWEGPAVPLSPCSPPEPVSSSLAQSVMSMASSQSQHSQLSTDTVSSMSGSYVAPGTEEEEEEGDMLPSPAAANATASDGEVGAGEVVDGANHPQVQELPHGM